MRNTKIIAALVFAALIAFAGQASAESNLFFDIAQNDHTFSFDSDPLLENGFPAYGNEFIVQAYLYPGDTLTGDDGVNPDGSPQYPELVLGEWTCRGWFVGDGFATVTGPVAITHQLFDLGDVPGSDTIATDGYELMDQGEVHRVVSGGTGTYNKTRGEQRQNNIGFNATGGMNIRTWIQLW